MSTYDIGNKVRVAVAFTNLLSAGVAVDPASVYCSVKTPANKKTDYQYGVGSDVVKSATGSYYIDLPLTRKGNWYVRWWGLDSDGVAQVAEEVTLKCTPHQAD